MSAAATESPVERGSLLAGGTRTRLRQAGPVEASEAVVFVHGNPGSADDWEGLIGAAASTGRRALAVDLPDFGDTIAPEGFEHTTIGYATFLGEALKELGVERAHLVLHDFGGPIGLVWVAMNPEALASITLIDTGILPGYRWHKLARIWRTPVVGELFQATATRSAFRMLLNRNEPRGLPRDFVEAMYDHYDRRTRKAVLALYRDTDDPGSLADLYTVPFNNRAGGNITPVAGASDPSVQEYYPAFSPDDAMIAFNRIPNDKNMYNQPLSEVWIVPSSGGTATRLAANDPPGCSGKVSPGVTNSWAKWAPDMSSASGGRTFYWIVFSSTRAGTLPQLYVTPGVGFSGVTHRRGEGTDAEVALITLRRAERD